MNEDLKHKFHVALEQNNDALLKQNQVFISWISYFGHDHGHAILSTHIDGAIFLWAVEIGAVRLNDARLKFKSIEDQMKQWFQCSLL